MMNNADVVTTKFDIYVQVCRFALFKICFFFSIFWCIQMTKLLSILFQRETMFSCWILIELTRFQSSGIIDNICLWLDSMIDYYNQQYSLWNLWYDPSAPHGTTTGIFASAAESEAEGVWTGWINNVDPYEEGHKGDLEIRNNMDPVSIDRYWTSSNDSISFVYHCIEIGKWTLTLWA